MEANSVDGIPIIDRLPQAASLYFGTGWCGHGWVIAPAVSRLLAGAMTGQRPAPLAPFAYGRFQL